MSREIREEIDAGVAENSTIDNFGAIFEIAKTSEIRCSSAAEGRRVEERKSWSRAHVVTCLHEQDAVRAGHI